MEKRISLDQSILIQMLCVAVFFMIIGASYGYFEAMREVHAHHQAIENQEISEGAK